KEIVTHGFGYPNDNAGKPVTSIVPITQGLIPKGAKNVTVAKEFLKYFIQPKVIGEFIELGLGRWLPVMPSLAKSAFWQNPKDPHLRGYAHQGLLGPTRPDFYVFNPAMAQVHSQHVTSIAMIDVAKEGVKPDAAIDKAFKRIEEIFAKYNIPRERSGEGWTAHRSTAPRWSTSPARPSGGARSRALCAATSTEASTRGRSPSSCPTSWCFSPLSPTRWSTGYGWAARRVCTGSYSPTRSTRARWRIPSSTSHSA